MKVRGKVTSAHHRTTLGLNKNKLYFPAAITIMNTIIQLYFEEIRPTLEILPSQLYNWLLEIITENEEDMGLIHPVLPDQVSRAGLHVPFAAAQ